jgi:hypothetical protein
VTALDTSVVIAAFAPWHEAHKVAGRAVTPEAVIPAHVVTETYAVLTRMPEPFRMDAQLVADYLAQQWGGRVIAPDAGLYESLTTAVATVGVTGGSSSGSPPSASVINYCHSTFGLNALTDLWGSIIGCSPGSSALQRTRLGDSTGGHCGGQGRALLGMTAPPLHLCRLN